ncbi:MAG: CopG family antitoxin [Dehalococcoidia bacterium]
MRTREPQTELTLIRSLDEIPSFATEAEETDYWGTHGFSDEILDQMGPLPADVLLPTRTRPISIRLNDDIVRRLKVVARKKGTGYQTLLKEFVIERLYEEERREGLIPAAE